MYCTILYLTFLACHRIFLTLLMGLLATFHGYSICSQRLGHTLAAPLVPMLPLVPASRCSGSPPGGAASADAGSRRRAAPDPSGPDSLSSRLLVRRTSAASLAPAAPRRSARARSRLQVPGGSGRGGSAWGGRGRGRGRAARPGAPRRAAAPRPAAPGPGGPHRASCPWRAGDRLTQGPESGDRPGSRASPPLLGPPSRPQAPP